MTTGGALKMNNAIIALGGMLLTVQLHAAGTVRINGKEVKSQDDLQTLLIRQLNLPKFYSRTHDSLYDVLSTDFAGLTEIRIKHLSILRSKLGPEYVDTLIQAVSDATLDNRKIILVLE